MKSELNIKTPNIKLSFVIGLCVTTLIVILSLIFRFEFGVILLSVAGSFVLVGATKALINFRQYKHLGKANNFELAKQQQELRLITYQADKAQLESFTLTFPNTHRIATLPDSPVNLIEGVVKQLPATIATNDAQLPDLMSIIENEKCVMFLGARGSGKSETAAHWIRQQGNLFVVCDPKVEKFNWPHNCKVFTDYDEIRKISCQIANELKRRQQRNFQSLKSITLFFDELHTLIENDIDVIKFVISIAAIGRSYNVHSAFTGLAMTQDYLGMKAAKLLDNFAQVRLTKAHKCFVNLGEGEFEVKHPGRYRHQIIANEDDKIRELIAQGLSTYAISTRIGNGHRNDKIFDRINSLR